MQVGPGTSGLGLGSHQAGKQWPCRAVKQNLPPVQRAVKGSAVLDLAGSNRATAQAPDWTEPPSVVVDSHAVYCVLQEAMEEQQKARIEQRKRMEVTIKRMDHLERARREVEAPLLQEQYAESLKVGLHHLLSCVEKPTCFRSSMLGSPIGPSRCWLQGAARNGQGGR